MELSGIQRLPNDLLAQIAESVKKSAQKKRKRTTQKSPGSTKAEKSTNGSDGSSTIVILEDGQAVSSSLPTAKKFLAQQQFGKRHKRVPLLTYQAQKYRKQPAKNFKN